MELTIAAQPTFVYTGGRPFDPQLPVVVLIHGAGLDHSAWNFQARALAHHGFAVIVPDLRGHGRSAGAPCATIEAWATWVESLLDALGVARAALVGHSMGSLIALQAAAQSPARTARLVLIGSVAPMPVADPLLDAARDRPFAAHAMINQWSYTPRAWLGASATPGICLTGLNRQLMARQAEGVLAADLAACHAYQGGLAAAAEVRCPTLMLCGERDQMTPLRAANVLFGALVNAAGGARMMTIPRAGHAMMSEAPHAVSDSLQAFLADG
jgi:pimeloyl-ACP methyl ester carboxylesterase